MTNIDEQMNLFKLLGSLLKKRIECIIIGGSAMLFYGAKTATKDIDIVFLNENDRKLFRKVVKSVGFKKKAFLLTEKYKNVVKKIPILMEHGDTKLDMFLDEVISFKISDDIKKRVKEVHEFENLIIKVISPEDIILLKSATDRVGDRVDAAELIKKFDIDWNVVIDECLWKMKNGKKIFPVFLFDFLEELKDMGSIIPQDVIRRVRKIGENEMIRALRNKNSKETF